MQATAPTTARAQLVYVGSGNGWKSLSTNASQWSYVGQHADGFYINFIELLNTSPAMFASLSPLFANKCAYFESDSRYTGLGGFPDGGQFSLALQAQELNNLLQGGFAVPYTSLNYGLDAAKEYDLRHIGLPAGIVRPCYTQSAPWEYGGDITGSATGNAQIRTNIGNSDGASSDGPLSLWQSNQGGMQNGSYSLVKYLRTLSKPSAVMVAPYNLNPVSQWLSVAQQCVRMHEDNDAEPDIWIVFEYATATPTLPESLSGGLPADTITGMAYYLLKHRDGDPGTLALSAYTDQGVKVYGGLTINSSAAVGSVQHFRLDLSNSSAWLDYAPVLQANMTGSGWSVQIKSGGIDVTNQVLGNGYLFYKTQRLNPQTTQSVDVYVTRTQASGVTQIDFSLLTHKNSTVAGTLSLSSTPIVTRLPTGQSYSIDNRATGLTLDSFRGGTRSGTLVVQNTAVTGQVNQKWTAIRDLNGYYLLKNKRNLLALNDSRGGTLSGTRVDQWTPDASDRQEWTVMDVGGGYYAFQNRHSGLVLDVMKATSSGTPVVQGTSSGSNSQQWLLTPVN